MVDLKIQYDDKQVLAKINGLDKAISNLKPVFKESGQFLVKEYKKTMDTEGTHLLGRRWKKLKPSTLADKLRLGYSPQILKRTGKLKSGFTIGQLTKWLVEVKNPVSYFKYHQSSAPRRVLPRRQMIGLNNKMIKSIVKLFEKYIKKTAKL